MLTEKQTVNESSDPGGTLIIIFFLKPHFVSGYIPGRAKKLPLFNFKNLFSLLKTFGNLQTFTFQYPHLK